MSKATKLFGAILVMKRSMSLEPSLIPIFVVSYLRIGDMRYPGTEVNVSVY